MFTEEWDSLDWEVSFQSSMKSVVLEMSVLSELPFVFLFFFTSIFYEAAVQFRCCSCVEMSWLGKSRIGMRKSGGTAACKNGMGCSGGREWGVCGEY